MSDLIRRQDAIDLIENESRKWGDEYGVSDVLCDLADLPSVQSEPKWIPCSEKLPEKYIGQWLCCTSDGAVMILPYDTPGDGTKECVFYKWDDDGYSYQTFDIVAWMPLPKPWKGEANEHDQ